MKAKIERVGAIVNGNPVGWSFDSYTDIPALQMSGMGTLYYGYSVKELEEIFQKYDNDTACMPNPGNDITFERCNTF